MSSRHWVFRIRDILEAICVAPVRWGPEARERFSMKGGARSERHARREPAAEAGLLFREALWHNLPVWYVFFLSSSSSKITTAREKDRDMLQRIVHVSVCLLVSLFTPITLFPNMEQVDKASETKNYLYDSNHVRYELYRTGEGKPYNWLFFPGGPGADSSYLRSLVDKLELPGNVWLIDLPGNGDNIHDAISENFDTWFEIFPRIIKQFENPVLVGHSFGGMFPLLFPELESYLKGFVILNSSPVLWMEEAVAYSKQFDLPDLSKEMHEFILNPSPETFKVAVDACMPYYFPKETLKKGRELLARVPLQYQPAVWWQRKAIELKYSAKWIPQNVPTLIIGSKYDCICPFSLFEKDKRFQRRNIELLFIKDAGHMSWVENPEAVRNAFRKIVARLDK